MQSIKLIFISFAVLAFASCKKDTVPTTDYRVLELPVNTEIHNIFFVDSITGYAVGGISNSSGFIFKTIDGGNNWAEIYHSDTNLNDIYFLKSGVGFACGDDILLLRTTDSGITWTKVAYGWEPPEAYIAPLKHIEFINDTAGYLTGGAYFDRGIIFRTQNRGLWWEPEHFDNELSASHFTTEKTGIFGGYGLITKTTDGAHTFQPVDISGDFYTAFWFTSASDGFACGYDGGIYKTIDFGNSWSVVQNKNSPGKGRIHLNDIAFTKTGKGIAVGNSGIILVSNDNGNSWEKMQPITSGSLFSVTAQSDGSVWITSANGKIYVLNL